MKKWALLFLAIVVVAGGYLWARNQRYVMPWNQPKWASVSRGDIRVPITASGLIEPNAKIEIKSKASGEIISILVVEGKAVHPGDVLIELRKDIEERNRDRAQSDLNLAKASLETARLNIKKCIQLTAEADANLDVLKAMEPALRTDVQKATEFKSQGSGAEWDLITKQAQLDQNMANQKGATARLEQAKLNISASEIAVVQEEENVQKAEKLLEDARERLDDTTIVAKQDAIVTEVKVRVGERIQGAETAFTGGTALLMLADVSKLKVVTKVDEADYGRIMEIAPVTALPELEYRAKLANAAAEDLVKRTGKVKLKIESFRDKEFEGIIERVEPQGRQVVGATVIQFDVHVSITGENRDILPLGAQAQVEFTVKSVQNALTVAADAVKSFENQQGVWVVTEPAPGERSKGKRFVACEVGITDGETTEIIRALHDEKLSEGELVYTRLPPEPKDQS